MQQYLVYAVYAALRRTDKSRLAAIYEALVDLGFPDDIMELSYNIIMAEKIKAVAALTAEIE